MTIGFDSARFNATRVPMSGFQTEKEYRYKTFVYVANEVDSYFASIIPDSLARAIAVANVLNIIGDPTVGNVAHAIQYALSLPPEVLTNQLLFEMHYTLDDSRRWNKDDREYSLNVNGGLLSVSWNNYTGLANNPLTDAPLSQIQYAPTQTSQAQSSEPKVSDTVYRPDTDPPVVPINPVYRPDVDGFTIDDGVYRPGPSHSGLSLDQIISGMIATKLKMLKEKGDENPEATAQFFRKIPMLAYIYKMQMDGKITPEKAQEAYKMLNDLNVKDAPAEGSNLTPNDRIKAAVKSMRDGLITPEDAAEIINKALTPDPNAPKPEVSATATDPKKQADTKTPVEQKPPGPPIAPPSSQEQPHLPRKDLPMV